MTKAEPKTIAVEGLTKVYPLYARSLDRLLEAVHPLRRKYHKDFHALAGVTFDIPRGQTVGIIGKNGSGKSTLLKIVTGVLTPTTGTVSVRGRMSTLLELGMGFNPEITGIENVFFTGAILGIPEGEMKAKLPEILAFAELGDYAGQPVKSYSSGMFVRLAFAVAIHVDPEILVIDEALSVGDMRFQQKCYRKIKAFKEEGVTILFVSHDTGAVINFCDRCLWLKDGRIERDGVPSEVVREYTAYMAFDAETAQATVEAPAPALESPGEAWVDANGFSSFGDRGAEIVRVAFVDRKTSRAVSMLEGGEEVSFRMDVVFRKDLTQLIYGILLKDQYGNQLINLNTFVYGLETRARRAGDRVVASLAFKFPRIRNGEYTLSCAVAEGTQEAHIEHHWVHDAIVVRVAQSDLRYQIGAYCILDEVGFAED